MAVVAAAATPVAADLNQRRVALLFCWLRGFVSVVLVLVMGRFPSIACCGRHSLWFSDCFGLSVPTSFLPFHPVLAAAAAAAQRRLEWVVAKSS
jgi:hypothetical protein